MAFQTWLEGNWTGFSASQLSPTSKPMALDKALIVLLVSSLQKQQTKGHLVHGRQSSVRTALAKPTQIVEDSFSSSLPMDGKNTM